MGFRQTIPLSILLVLSLTPTNCIELCRRMALTGFRGNNKYISSPYMQFSGTYEVQDFEYNKFVVLKSRNIYFFYDDSRNRFMLGTKLGAPSIIGAIPKSPFSIDSWKQKIELNNPFASIIDSWFQILPLTPTIQQRIYDNILFKCVDDDYLSCFSGRLEFNQTLLNYYGKSLNVYGQHYYEWQPHLYVKNRPVYMQRNTTFNPPFYLYYTDLSDWQIGRGYTHKDLQMYVGDIALKPDELTSTVWMLYSWRRTRSVQAKLQCQGVTTILGRSCMDADNAGQCLNNGSCHMTSTNEALCICPDGFHGVRCEKPNVECSKQEILIDASSSLTNYLQVISNGNEIGHIATFFCPLGFTPVYFYAVCQVSDDNVTGEWMGIEGCRRLPPPPQTTIEVRTTERYYTVPYEEPEWLYDLTVWSLSILQYGAPLIAYFILSYLSLHLDGKQTLLKGEQYDKLLNCQRAKLLTIIKDDGITDEQKTTQFRELDEWFEEEEQKYKEIRRKIKAKRKVKNIGFCRIYSLVFNIGFWFWIPIVSICGNITGSDTADGIRLLGLISIGITYVWVLFESLFSREFGYLKGLTEVKYAAIYLAELRKVPPHLVMRAECYHYEMRTRIVYDTDANGNQNSRLETYQERVVTRVGTKVFRYSFWIDTSDTNFTFTTSYAVTRIKLKQSIYPGDAISRQALTDAEDAFKDEYRNYDTSMDYNLEIDIEGFMKRLAAYTDPAKKPWWISSRHFLVATIFGLTWGYRWVFRACTSKASYKLVKRIYTTRPESTNDIETNDLITYSITTDEQNELCAKQDAQKDDGKGKKRNSLTNQKKDKKKNSDDGAKKLETINIHTGTTKVNQYYSI